MSVNMNKPIEWQVFKTLSERSKVDYLQFLQREFNASQRDIADAFGITPLALKKHIDNNSLPIKFKKPKSPTPVQRDMWGRFLRGDITPKQITMDLPTIEDEAKYGIGIGDVEDEPYIDDNPDVCEASEPVEIKRPVQAECAAQSMSMDAFNIKFNGRVNSKDIADAIKLLAGDGSFGNLEISFTRDNKWDVTDCGV